MSQSDFLPPYPEDLDDDYDNWGDWDDYDNDWWSDFDDYDDFEIEWEPEQ